jgi:hypothetical protein
MQKNKPIIQLSDHVKNKIKSHRITSFSVSSEELNLSDNTDNDNDSLISISPQKLVRKRRSTCVTYQIQSQPVFTEKSRQTQLCQECLRRENLIQTEHQNLLRIQKENKNLSEQFRSLILLNQQYEEENIRLKQYLTKLNTHLQEYQMNFNLLRQKMISEKKKK